MIAHLQRLGVTAVSLLPVHQHLDEQRLVARGLTNYWGYNTIGFFAVEPRYASGAGGLSPRQEFRAMVRGLHAAGIEVILDVVFNHTAETDDERPDALLARPRQPELLPHAARASPASTTTSAAAATRSTCAIRACCRW